MSRNPVTWGAQTPGELTDPGRPPVHTKLHAIIVSWVDGVPRILWHVEPVVSVGMIERMVVWSSPEASGTISPCCPCCLGLTCRAARYRDRATRQRKLRQLRDPRGCQSPRGQGGLDPIRERAKDARNLGRTPGGFRRGAIPRDGARRWAGGARAAR